MTTGRHPSEGKLGAIGMAKKPGPLASSLSVFFLIAFFGCGAVVVANLFFKFLSEEAFAILALGMLAILFVLAVVGKCISVLRFMRPPSSSADNPRDPD